LEQIASGEERAFGGYSCSFQPTEPCSGGPPDKEADQCTARAAGSGEKPKSQKSIRDGPHSEYEPGNAKFDTETDNNDIEFIKLESS
jgi:hypothetical protein